MRYILFTLLFFVVAAIVKIDLQEGTLPLASFYEEEICQEQIQYEWQHLNVRVQPNDTLHSLFASSPTNVSFPERLSQFYKINPHLQQQSLKSGEVIKLPILKEKTKKCI